MAALSDWRNWIVRLKPRSIIKASALVVVGVLVLGDVFLWTLARTPRPKGPVAGVVGVPLTFEGKAKYDPARIHFGQWDFGDGTVSDWEKLWKRTKDPVTRKRGEKGPGPGRIQTHAYASPGTYQVRWRGRCPYWVFVQPWSDELTVVISPLRPD